MPKPSTSARECPSPLDERVPLIAHQIDAGTCAGRQAAQYHKCFSCEHFAHSADRPLPSLPPLTEAIPVLELHPTRPPEPPRTAPKPAAARRVG